MKKSELALFIFRRDLRLTDNTALLAACKEYSLVLPCFIFDPRQIGGSNPYKSVNAIQFMVESLQDLERQLADKAGKLFLFYGAPDQVVMQLLRSLPIEAVFINADYTPFSQERDGLLEAVCRDHKVKFSVFDDALLNPPFAITKSDKSYYSVFTPYWKSASKVQVARPVQLRKAHFFIGKIKQALGIAIYHKVCPVTNTNLYQSGGRANALAILAVLAKFKDYTAHHDIAALENTCLSAHLKFGTVSVREVFHAVQQALGENHPLLRQLYWRDFYTQIAFHAPFVFGHSYQKKYEKLWWSQDKSAFEKWCTGKTGFPLVDAGMRQLNQTGFMHNRVRMVVAAFLTKDLHIDWRWGERYFAQYLLDYDPAVNNGNWQWCASTGCDHQPWFRIFNPWLQQKKFDSNCDYIKRWVTELQDIEPSIIHRWYDAKSPAIKGYPRPMLDHATESDLTKKIFRGQ
ncbi:MAG TPA: deoxyribodipyrimidine photo-lyase [Gammaproteobacteria bacterium]|nr:deoxyribodipyrimidine photo-lyase [Gammaproteobacteria bacterium]